MFLYMVIDDITQLAVTYHCAEICSPAKMMVVLLHNIGFNVSTLLKWNEMFIFFTYTSARIQITNTSLFVTLYVTDDVEIFENSYHC